MARRPGRIWKVKETGKIAFAYHKDQEPEFTKAGKVLIYVTEVSQLSLFDDLPPVEQCRKVLKSISTLKHVGYFD